MDLEIFDLGLIDFEKAWRFQKEVVREVKNGGLKQALVVCRHYPVITLGRLAQKGHLLVSREELSRRGIPLYPIERGGSFTYHGPGQIIVYPVLDLSCFAGGIHAYLRKLEQTAMDLLSDFGIYAVRRPGFTGVWVGDKKISSIGIAVKNWVAYHGLSINVKKDDLGGFSLIRPCGLDIGMTSLETILQEEVAIEDVKYKVIAKFRDIFTAAAGEEFCEALPILEEVQK